MAHPVRGLDNPSATQTGLPARRAKAKSALYEYGEAFAIAVVLAMFIRTFFVQAYKIPSGSMEPTLLIGDHIMVNKLVYGLRMPDSLFGMKPLAGEIPYGRYLFRLESVHRGDIVVFVFPPDPSKDFIKRVIGMPGDRVAVKNGVVYLNGERMADPHAHFEVPPSDRLPDAPRDNFGPITVPPHVLFMMGDNRDRSWDSRFWGFVDVNNIEGRAMFIYWSDDDSTAFLGVRWSRLGGIVR